MPQTNLSTKQKQTLRHRHQAHSGQRGVVGGQMEEEFEVSRCKLLYIDWTNNKVLLYNTGNYIQ